MVEQTLKIILNADGGGLVEVLDDGADGFDELGDEAEKAGKKAKKTGTQLGFVERETRKLFKGTRSLVNGLGGLKSALLGLGVGALAKQFIDAASTSEQLRVRLRVLLGSVSEGNRLFQDMADFASRVPFEFESIIGAATTLSGALGGGVDEVNRIIPLVADLAAASGLTIETATEQIVRLFNAGALSAEILKDQGLLALVGLQAGVSMSAEETKKTVLASYESTTSRIKGATDALAQTWVGALSMVSDKWFAFRNLVMDAGVFDYLKSVVAVVDEELATGLDSSKQAADLWAAAIIEGIEQVVGAAGVMADGFHGVRIGFKALELGWNGVQLLLLTGIDVVLTALIDLKTEYAGLLNIAKFIPSLSIPAFAIDKLLDTEKLDSGRAAIQLWKKDVEASVATIKEELDGLASFLPSGELDKFMDRVRAKFDESRAAAAALAAAMGDVGAAADGAGKKTKPLTTEQIAARKATDDLKKSLQFELDQLKRTDREKAVANALRGLSVEQINAEGDAIERLAGKLFDEEAAIRAATAAEEDRLRDLEKTAEAQAEAFRRPFENALDGIQDAGVDMFESIFSGGVNSAKDFGRTLKTLFTRLAAELAALLVFRPVLSGIGLAGISGAANAGGGGLQSLLNSGSGGSGGLSLSNITSFFGDPVGALANAAAFLQSTALNNGFKSVASFFQASATNLTNLSNLGVGAAGFGGNFLGNSIFGNDRGAGANIGGTIGALAGSFIPIPFLGTAIGSFLGNAIGGLFGGSSQPTRPKVSIRANSTPGSAFVMPGTEAIDTAPFLGLADAISTQATTALAAFGASLNEDFRIWALRGQAGFELESQGINVADPRYRLANQRFGAVGGRTSTPDSQTLTTLAEATTLALIKRGALDIDNASIRRGIRTADSLEFVSNAAIVGQQFGEEFLGEALKAIRWAAAGNNALNDTAAGLAGIIINLTDADLATNALTQLSGAINAFGEEAVDRAIEISGFHISSISASPTDKSFADLTAVGNAISTFGQDVVDRTVELIGFLTADQFARDATLVGLLDPGLGGTAATANLLAEGIKAIDDSFALLTVRALQLGLPLDRLNELRDAEKRQLEQTLGLGGVRDLLNNLTATSNSPLANAEVLANATALFRSTLASGQAGDQQALNDLPGFANNLIGLLRDNFASGANFFNGRDATGGSVGPGFNNAIGSVAGYNEIVAGLQGLLGIPGFADGGITRGLSFAGESGPEAVIPLPNGRTIPVTLSANLIVPVVQEIRAGTEAAAANTGDLAELLQDIRDELQIANRSREQALQPKAVANA